ncbi:unnamed protein product [Bursaphelenchus okinawaensis]|uniref:G protein-coupled receptor n=1 Tax=Bursaphelenchus okinawaensis TaxID=465554 RepID=A0A811LVT9_9BILA|nr:unnamed protein product [Bursaphelenchus okinawaensis]CAG9128506.1 unnamed protein product [Bursaphelenchus okinawaensis]
MTARSKRMQAQFSTYMAYQACIPIIISVGPTLWLVTSQFIGYDADVLSNISVGLYSWLPFFNSTVTIVVIVPYRKPLLRLFCKHRVKPTSYTDNNTDLTGK